MDQNYVASLILAQFGCHPAYVMDNGGLPGLVRATHALPAGFSE
jgi:hypothetical protein